MLIDSPEKITRYIFQAPTISHLAYKSETILKTHSQIYYMPFIKVLACIEGKTLKAETKRPNTGQEPIMYTHLASEATALP